MFRRDAYVYVGVDVHKSAHVGMMMDCFGDPMGKALKVANQITAFPEWLEAIHKRAQGKGVVFGLEDVHGLGRALATYLLGRGYIVKFANAYLTKKERDSVNKTDRNDALAVARITAKQYFTLPDADVDELQWALIQAVHYRRGLVEEQTRVKNRLHAFLTQAHPAYLTYFSEEFGKTALAFWERYPAASALAGVTVEELGQFLREVSHFALGYKQAEKILSACQGAEARGFQGERDYLIRSAVRELRHLEEQLSEGRKQLERLVNLTDYRLTDIPGIDVVMSAELIALVGEVTRFPKVDHFLAYAGIAPVVMGTGDHETRLRSQFGRRELMALFHRIASTQLVVHHKTGEPRNPEAKAYFDKCLGEQAKLPKEKQDRKVRKKALLSLMRAQARRFYTLMKRQKLAAEARRAQEGPGVA
ncbi:MAG TPA: IS110 family transposase [Symbiobacteriaceae bacterium]|nr:IS110 family transposase [Symbiobacteriaceae bacterium]